MPICGPSASAIFLHTPLSWYSHITTIAPSQHHISIIITFIIAHHHVQIKITYVTEMGTDGDSVSTLHQITSFLSCSQLAKISFLLPSSLSGNLARQSAQRAFQNTTQTVKSIAGQGNATSSFDVEVGVTMPYDIVKIWSPTHAEELRVCAGHQ